MRQSLDLSTSLYEVLDGSLHAATRALSFSRPRLVAALVSGVLDAVILPYVPGFWAWNHEEFHRAVLSRRGYDSENSVNRFPFGKDLIPVDHVRDADLIALKASHPAEMARLSSAGLEGDIEHQTDLARVSFFYRTRGPHWVQLALSTANVSGYMWTCALNNQKEKDKANANEGTEEERDFTGLDCVAATYDMHRPYEPYAARGMHPSGVGIDRYRAYEELSSAEQRYLRSQAALSLVNFLNPHIIGFSGIRFTWHEYSAKVTANLLWQPAPFGQTVGAVSFVAVEGLGNFIVRADAFLSQSQFNPGVSIQPYDIPVTSKVSVGGRGSVWLQPKDSLFVASERAPGGLLGVRTDWRALPNASLFAEVESKTSGWVPGSVYLGANVSARIGTTLWFN